MVNLRQLLLNNSMKVFVNGEAKEIQKPFILSALIEEFSLSVQGIAIEVNKEVVRKRDWSSLEIREADRIEIVHLVGGG